MTQLPPSLRRRKVKLGEVLRERGHISAEELYEAIQEQQGRAVLLGELLLERGLVRKEDVASALEEISLVPYVDCHTAKIEPEALEMIPYSVALRYCALPIGREDRKLVTVMAEPQDLHAIAELRFISGMDISPRLGFRAEIRAAIEQYYTSEPSSVATFKPEDLPLVGQVDDESIEFETASSPARNSAAIKEYQAEINKQRTPAVRLVSAIIAAAVAKRASDIHIEPQASGTVVRIRVDGILRELTHAPPSLQNSLVSRVKILADMDIAERRAPQDGRFLVRIAGNGFDLRVSTLPTQYGEKVVLRVLDPTATRVGFSDLGLSPENCAMLEQALAKPQGMLLVTGPTGSGKSTTLYAALNHIFSPTINIITVEDPVEYMIEGANQVQVNARAGMTFSNSLRSILRQDPNVIMVGEIRDGETAEISLKASQTGHLVLSTLHTNDSVAAVMRLLDLNISPALIASSVTAIMAQRLVRKLCVCRREVPIAPEYAARLTPETIHDLDSKMYVPGGCPACDHTGYKGRVGAYELLLLDEQIGAAIRSGASSDEIRAMARSAGMKLMHEDALQKVKRGLTTFEEMLRAVPFRSLTTPRCRGCGADLPRSGAFCSQCGARQHDGINSPPPAAMHAREPATPL